MARIAIVEDNPDNRLLLEALLEDDYELLMFEDGPGGLAGIRATNPDLAVLDISLPGMDGVALLAALREDPATASIPAIALTAHAMAGDEERFRAAGFDGYVTKPIVDEGILLGAIERLLANDG